MNKLFLIGIIAGLGGALSLAAVFATISSQSTAQMMGNYNGQMGPGMMYNNRPATAQSSSAYTWHNTANFKVNGISNVNHVQITGVSITGDHEVTVNVRYDSNTTTPSITVIAATNPSSIMGMMNGYNYAGMMGSYGYGTPMMYGYYGYNATQIQNLHNQMIGSYYGGMMYPYFNNQTLPNFNHFSGAQLGTGSIVLNSGWQSGTTVKVKLDGEGSAYDNFGIHVMIFPLTS